jgi:hypothetical protein
MLHYNTSEIKFATDGYWQIIKCHRETGLFRNGFRLSPSMKQKAVTKVIHYINKNRGFTR